MKNNVITVNYDNVKYRLVVGQRFYTGYYKDGTKPQRFDIFDDINISGFLHLADVTKKYPVNPLIHNTGKNTFVWGGFEGPEMIVRYDDAGQRMILNKLSTKHGRELARAMLRRKAQKAAA